MPQRPEQPVKLTRKRTLAKPVPAEGEGGLFTQSWYPIVASARLPAGEIVGADFLDGRVVAFRGEDGAAHVMSAYCPHLGADLSTGSVVGSTVRCAFHHWRFDPNGTCVQTGAGDPPPAAACIFKFPTAERYGMVWAFNGEAPLFDLPSFPYPDGELVFKAAPLGEPLDIDPWVIGCNVPDLFHAKTLHGMNLGDLDLAEGFEWYPHSVMYDFDVVLPGDVPFRGRYGLFGTSVFYLHGEFMGRWFGIVLGYGLPSPGKTEVQIMAVARRADGDEEKNAAYLDSVIDLEKGILAQDRAVLGSIHFRPGVLTKSDRALARFFDYLRSFPRAHPSADFIR